MSLCDSMQYANKGEEERGSKGVDTVGGVHPMCFARLALLPGRRYTVHQVHVSGSTRRPVSISGTIIVVSVVSRRETNDSTDLLPTSAEVPPYTSRGDDT